MHIAGTCLCRLLSRYQRFSDDFPTEDAIPKLEDFHAAFDVVFVDPSGFLNLMAHTTVGLYFELKHEAERALALLDDRVNDGFDALFMTPVPWHNKFDLTVVCDKVTPQIARRYVLPPLLIPVRPFEHASCAVSPCCRFQRVQPTPGRVVCCLLRALCVACCVAVVGK